MLTLCDNATCVRPRPDATPDEVAEQVVVLATRLLQLEQPAAA